MTIQKIFDAIAEGGRMTRGNYGLTLGRLIKRLEALDPEAIVAVGHPHSYRGYYSDLSFSPDGEQTVGEWLGRCRQAVGETFTGWKGGDFTMGEDTPVWVSCEGSTGPRLMDIIPGDGVLRLILQEEQWGS